MLCSFLRLSLYIDIWFVLALWYGAMLSWEKIIAEIGTNSEKVRYHAVMTRCTCQKPRQDERIVFYCVTYTMPAYIESPPLYSLAPCSMAPGPWFLQGPCNDSSCTVLASWSLAPGPWLLVHGMLVQVANGCRIETWAVMAVSIATSPRKGAGRRGASWDSSFLMILYISNTCTGRQFFIA